MNRIKKGDRLRHIRGHEGTACGVVNNDDTAMIAVRLDEGGIEISSAGYWEQIPTERLSA